MSSYTIDPATERLLDLGGIIKWMEERGARRPHVNGVRRWFRGGVRGIRLPSVMVAGCRYSTAGALLWWIAATSQVDAPSGAAQPAAASVTPHERKVLERAGILDAGAAS